MVITISLFNIANAYKIYEFEEELAQKDTLAAQQKLAAFEAYGDVESNYKKVFDIYINNWMKDKYGLSKVDSSSLQEIALQSPRVAGNAVYMARVMLSIDTTDTETYYAKSTNVQAIKVNEQLKLYPNPGSEFIHYQLPIEESENGIVRIIDISGKLLIEWTVDFNCSIGSLDVSQYSNGIYMFELELTNGKSIIKKLVVE